MPRAVLAELGIHASEEDVPLASLPEPLLALAGRRLAVPHDRQITFLEMERLYRLRAPLTKHPRLLVPQLSRIAEDYARAGVTYVELSLSDVVRGEVLRAIHREVPEIEARTGVTLRFLAAISRHDDLEWDLDVIDRLEEIAPSPYVVGLDVMGHETTSTRSFARQLTACAERMGALRPGWVIRVHAGESPAFPGNVREALELARGHDVRLRIGHGLYGVDAATLDALVREGVIVEFNLTSNFSLNNVQSLADVPLVRYARAGARVVLGSDGPGLYETDACMEARAARLAGLDEDDLARIRETEARYAEERLALDARSTRPEWEPSGDLVSRRFGPAVIARRRERREARDARLHRALADRSITLLGDAELDALVAGRRVVSIAGSWKNTWSATPPKERAAITRELEALVRALEGAVLITGGTRFGVEREAQRAARDAGVDVVAAIVSESPPDDLCADVRWATLVAEDLYAKAAGLYQLVRRLGGACVFVGGGPIVNDEIQIAHNLRLPILLMDGPPGASTRHARERPDAAFRTAGEALGRLAARGPRPAPFWYLGPNPTADVVLLRDDGDALRFLAIRRDLDAPCEAGRWALPGGFVRTDAARGEPWRAGVEPALEAALRELREEAGLDLTGARGLVPDRRHVRGRRPRPARRAGGVEPLDRVRAALARGAPRGAHRRGRRRERRVLDGARPRARARLRSRAHRGGRRRPPRSMIAARAGSAGRDATPRAVHRRSAGAEQRLVVVAHRAQAPLAQRLERAVALAEARPQPVDGGDRLVEDASRRAAREQRHRGQHAALGARDEALAGDDRRAGGDPRVGLPGVAARLLANGPLRDGHRGRNEGERPDAARRGGAERATRPVRGRQVGHVDRTTYVRDQDRPEGRDEDVVAAVAHPHVPHAPQDALPPVKVQPSGGTWA
ncbi:MAG: NUDIX domain-containing protein [Sandaracinaceae bacterium]|nr:NUDIX domain-containing protein [Sandaracinaceae bacterium]